MCNVQCALRTRNCETTVPASIQQMSYRSSAFFQEGMGPASFNSNRVDILATYTRDCYFCMLPHSLLVHFSWGKAITTANDCHSVCMTSSVVIIVCTLIYCVCVNIKFRDNNIRECAPFTKFAKIIDRKNFATYSICIQDGYV